MLLSISLPGRAPGWAARRRSRPWQRREARVEPSALHRAWSTEAGSSRANHRSRRWARRATAVGAVAEPSSRVLPDLYDGGSILPGAPPSSFDLLGGRSGLPSGGGGSRWECTAAAWLGSMSCPWRWACFFIILFRFTEAGKRNRLL